jgi:hypothetical protein
MTNAQVIKLYEEGRTIEEIAEVFEMDKQAIEMALIGGSAKYRKEIKKSEKTFSEDLEEFAKAKMGQLLFTEGNENIVYKASKFIINENKGRHDLVKNIQGANININLFNVELEKAKKAIARAKERVIDVPHEALEAA